MRTPSTGAYIIERLVATTRQVVHDILELLPVAAFIFISATPGQSLAFVEDVELAHQPLEFARDPSLAGSAIVGIEAFPGHHTAGALLHSRASRIPDAALNLQPGMAVRVMSAAYSSTIDQTDGNPFGTASGTTVHPGTLAANFLPFGTVVRIGNQLYTVEDRLNARYNGKYIVDVWQESRQAALAYGVRVVEMEIVSIPE